MKGPSFIPVARKTMRAPFGESVLSHKRATSPSLKGGQISYTDCPRSKGPNFGRVFLKENYNDITQNTYIEILMITEILVREL